MLDDEQELLRTHPHILAYFPHYALWFWFIAVGVTGLLAGPAIGNALHGSGGSIPLTSIAWSALTPEMAWFMVWAVAVLLPVAILPFFAISFRWLVAMAIVLGLGGLIVAARSHVYGAVTGLLDAGFLQPLWDATGKPSPNPAHYESALLLVFGILGVIVVEFRRGSHLWILTNKRLIARFGIISKSERDLLYSSIDDIVIHQSLLGSLFHFGTVIPLSMGGLAADSVEAETKVKSKSGKNKEGGPAKPRKRGIKVELGNGRRVLIPRRPTFYMLWGVPRPRDRKDLILAQIGKGAAAPRPAPSARAGAISQRQAVTDTD